MTLDIRLRGYLEEEIDVFIKEPMTYIKIARNRNAKSMLDFILGFFYGRLSTRAATFSVNHQIPENNADVKEVVDLINRRSLEIIDAIQRELEKEGIGGNSI